MEFKELSGLGPQNFIGQDMLYRYKIICETARTRSIISVGLCMFRLLKCTEKKKKKRIKYECQVFKISFKSILYILYLYLILYLYFTLFFNQIH